jgi:hypothetical protein
MSITDRIRRLAEEGLYYLSEHALQEAEADDLDIFDVETVLLHGKQRRIWSREGKHEIVGESIDGRQVGVVCRITEGGKVRVITVYEDKE